MRVVERTKVLVWGQDEVFTRIVIDGGAVTDFAVVYFTLMGGRPRQVVRFDCRHGLPHKDALYKSHPEKQAMPRLPLKTLLNMALDDIGANWRAYKRQYEREHGI